MNTDHLQALTNRLASARHSLQHEMTELQTLYMEFEQRLEVKEVAEEIKDLKEMIAALERSIKSEALDFYQTTQQKKPCEGVGVRILTSFIYDTAEVKSWAVKNAPILLKTILDEKAFLDLCKSKNTRPDFVTVLETPQATISKELRPPSEDYGLNRQTIAQIATEAPGLAAKLADVLHVIEETKQAAPSHPFTLPPPINEGELPF